MSRWEVEYERRNQDRIVRPKDTSAMGHFKHWLLGPETAVDKRTSSSEVGGAGTIAAHDNFGGS